MSRSFVGVTFLLCVMLFCASVSGAFATWWYAEDPAVEAEQGLQLKLYHSIFVPEDMPSDEVAVVQRLNDILNGDYNTDKITDSLDYLINETIQVYWGGNIYADPYVGSMDANFSEQISELFKNVLFEDNVSFILKHQDLNGDGYREVAMYSTSDPLDCVQEYDGTVCVYVTVFTPQVDAQKNIIGYDMVCESLRGYCCEVYYGQGDTTPSFSTDEWRDDIGYYHYFDETFYRVPEDAIGIDGVTPLRNHYPSYNIAYEYMDYMWGTIRPYGRMLWECLINKIPYI